MKFEYSKSEAVFSFGLIRWQQVAGCVAVALVLLSGQATAQTTSTGTTKSARQTQTRSVTVQESFEPAFNIEPLSLQIEGRAGDVIPFQFSVQAINRAAKIEVAPIGLRQEPSGQILHDVESTQTDAIRLISPATMDLQANTPGKIEGVVQIPKGEAKFHSVGILVRDVGIGNEITPRFNPDGSRQTQAGIRFMTQYVLRLDLSVKGARGEEGRQLQIEQVAMTSFEGRPRLQVMVLNPTDTTFQFELRGRLKASPSDRSMKPLRMVMPVRKSVQDDTRYVARVLPKSRLRMEEMLPEAIAGGEYEVELELLLADKVVTRKSLPLEVNALDFPAQEVLIAQVDDGLQVSPAQVELSQARGGSRRVTMLLKNHSKETKSIKLSAVGNNELDISTVMIQPNEFQLPASSSRKVSLTMRSLSAPPQSVEYGRLIVDAGSSERDYKVSRELPLALVFSETGEPDVTLSPLAWDASYPYPSFRTRLANQSDTHLVLQARLTIADESGRRISIPSGFGRWLMPQSSTNLDFRLESPLTPGQYRLRCELQRKGEPLVVEQVFTVTDMDTATNNIN